MCFAQVDEKGGQSVANVGEEKENKITEEKKRELDRLVVLMVDYWSLLDESGWAVGKGHEDIDGYSEDLKSIIARIQELSGNFATMLSDEEDAGKKEKEIGVETEEDEESNKENKSDEEEYRTAKHVDLEI